MFSLPSFCNTFSHLKLVFFAVVISVSVLVPVDSARSSSTSSAESSGGGSSNQGTSLVPSSTLHYRDRGDRELISAQFRAAQDARDLDTSESSINGMESLSAAAAAAAHHAGLDEDNLSLVKYMAASASTYSPSKMRMNRYNQAGFYDPYPSYSGTFPSSVPSSYYPYNAYSYRDSNPMLDTYPYYERDRIRELRERAMQASQSTPMAFGSSSSSGSSSNRDGYGGGGWGGGGGGYREGYRSSDHDNSAMSSGHGHDDHGGGGHGWGWGKEYTSKVNTNAIGLLGLLGLLSLLSNVLLQFTTTTTTTTAAARRRKRSSPVDLQETHEERRERIFKEILPHLTPIAHAKDGLLPLECTLHGLCMANRLLVDELGFHGRTAGQRISNAVVKLLNKVGKSPTSSHKEKKSSGGKLSSRKKLESAALHGRNKKNCDSYRKSYPICNSLRKQTIPSLPFIIRMQDLPELISKFSNLSKFGGGAAPMDL